MLQKSIQFCFTRLWHLKVFLELYSELFQHFYLVAGKSGGDQKLNFGGLVVCLCNFQI